MKRRSIQLQHPAGSTRIRPEIAFLSVCVLVGLVTFFAGAHAQVATPNPAASATPTPAPTATPFPTFAPLSTPRREVNQAPKEQHRSNATEISHGRLSPLDQT